MSDSSDRLILVLRALADPTRLAMVEGLRQCGSPVALHPDGQAARVNGATVGEMCCRITGSKTVTPTLSHHLRILREAGVVETRRQGRHLVCTLVSESLTPLSDWLKSHDQDPSFPQCPRC